jgi:hypothetical protein
MRTQIIHKDLYTFDELSDRAKGKARDWWRESLDYDWWDSVYDDFGRICEILGVDLKTHTVPLMNGKTRENPCVYFTGFSYQGDGASFEGWHTYKKGSRKAIREYCGDTELHRIADTLADLNRRHFYRLDVNVSTSGNYYHEYTMDVETTINGWNVGGETETDMTEIMRDLARWLYRSLRDEYEWLTSDEQVDESIRANEYEFDEDGKIA